MKHGLTVLILAALLAGCGTVRESRLNPFNWFGRGVSEPVQAADTNFNPLIPRRRASIFRDTRPEAYLGRPVGEVTELLIERRPGGAIIRATGIADTLGPHDVRFVKDEEASDADTLAYSFRAVQVRGPAGSARSRTVTAAVFLSDIELRDIRTIRVTGLRNSQVSRR